MIRRGYGQVRNKGDKQHQIAKAFHEACEDFRNQNGRQPNWDIVTFQGGFSSFQIVFEISEDDEH